MFNASEPVRYRDACLRFTESFSLKQVNWQINAGEHWVLLGPNGAGKSALAASVAGAGQLYQGEIDGRPKKVGLVSFEVQKLIIEQERDRDESDLTDEVFEGTPVRQLLEESAGDPDVLASLIRAFDFEDKLDRGFKALSTGETRKLILIRAFAGEPDVLVLDEPFDGLDTGARQYLSHRLAELSSQVTMIFVLNRLDEIPLFVNRMGYMANAELKQVFEVESGAVPAALVQLLHLTTTELDVPPQDPASSLAALPVDEPLVQLRKGRVAYGEQVVFDDLDWTVNPGEHWQVRGPNGSGKTCLLNLVTGDHPQCYVNDIKVVGYQRGQGESIWDIKQHIGFVSTALQWEYRVSSSLQNVIISGFYDSIGLYQKATDNERAIAHQWLRLLGLANRADQPFNQCSYGDQRLLLIARAMVKHPRLLILDEPTLGLDEINRHLVLALVTKICETSATTVIYVNHHEEDRVAGILRVLDLGTRAALEPG